MPAEDFVITRGAMQDPIIASESGGTLIPNGSIITVGRIGLPGVKPFSFVIHIYELGEIGQAPLAPSELVCVMLPQNGSADLDELNLCTAITLPFEAPLGVGQLHPIITVCHQTSSLKNIPFYSLVTRSPFLKHNYRYLLKVVGINNKTQYESWAGSLPGGPLTEAHFYNTYTAETLMERDVTFFTVYDKEYLEAAVEDI